MLESSSDFQNKGLLLSDLYGSEITDRDEDELAALLKIKFGIDYSGVLQDGKGTRVEPTKLHLILDHAKRNNWSRETLKTYTERFMAKRRWPNWDPAEFWEETAEDPLDPKLKLYGKSWYLDHTDDISLIEAYLYYPTPETSRADALQVYRYADGTVLPNPPYELVVRPKKPQRDEVRMNPNDPLPERLDALVAGVGRGM